MENFIFQNPVKLIMGRGMIASLSKEIPMDKRIMITFGGGSVKRNGVYDQVKEKGFGDILTKWRSLSATLGILRNFVDCHMRLV